jgi:nucleoside 2-deoxyribosyltransferase
MQFPPGKQFSLNDLGEYAFSAEVPLFSTMVASRLMPIGWNRSVEELSYMVTEVLCNEMGLLVRQNKQEYQVSPKGLLYLEGLREIVSSIGFCAMWFSEEVRPIWMQVIEPAIRAAGYEPLRIDSKQHNGKIDDEIMASIRASRFVVSDFTGNRGGVYYEAGFAHGLGLPVIFMCREGDDLHFDVRQYNCIFWKADALEDARDRLKNRLLATLGQGPLRVQ